MLTERQSEALRYDISLCVTAGAGTGKTHVLVNRYIRLIEEAGCRPSEILALTFTDKAASEMKERVEKEIFLKSGPLWEQIKEEMMWANISTFHSFCSKILREFSIEAGIEPGFSVLSDNESEEIIAGALSSLFGSTPENSVKESLENCLCAYGTYYLEIFLRELHRQRRYSDEFFEKLGNDEDSIVNEWKSALLYEKTGIASEFKNSDVLVKAADALISLSESFAGDTDKASKYLKAIKEPLSLLKSENAPDICKGLYGIAATPGGSKAMGSKKVFGDFKELLTESYSALKEYADGLPSDILVAEIERDNPQIDRTIKILKSLGIVFNKLEDSIRHEKHIRGAIDFTDMINLTYELFKNHPEPVAKSYAKRFRFIMIDEFQDTDPVQAEIISGILKSSEPDSVEKSSEETPACSKLFVVGDPKQSIYLFRDADVTQFKRSGAVIKDEYKGGLVSLDINFRSTKEVLSFVNCLFANILKDTKKPWDFFYEPVSVSDRRAADKGSVEIIISPRAEKASERAVLEAEAVAKKIRAIADEGKTIVYSKPESSGVSGEKKASWGDIAILIERRTNLKYLEYALKNYDIPYRVYGGLGLYEKQEILDVKSVLSFLKNPDNDISLYACLRSPWFGFSDAELFRICGGYAEGLFGKLKRAETEKAKGAYEMLSSWLLCARKKSPSEIFRQIIRDSGVTAVYAGLHEGIQAMANLEKLSDIIREREKGGFYTLDKLVAELSSSVASNDREGEAEPEDTGEDAVMVMTVHASKGLEFPIVIIPGLSDSPQSDNSSIIIDGELGAGIKIPDFETGDDYVNSPPLSVQKYRQKQKMHAESKRLFYVAATRARDHLIMCASEPKEIPASSEACKTRTDWVMFFLFSEQKEGIREGIYDAGEGCENCTIKVTRSENLPDYKKMKTGCEYIYFPDLLENLPDKNTWSKCFERCQTVDLKDKSSKVYSATEIETYRHSPEKHREIFEKKIRENPLLKAGSRSVRTGKIIHGVFAGEEPLSVIAKYSPGTDENPDEYLEIYRRFMESAFMKDAGQSFCELSFTTEIEGYRFSGSIDRLVEKTDGWYIIDYKTGEEKSEDYYSIQMAVYKKAAGEILGCEPKTFIYHTESGEFTEVSPDMKSMRSLIKAACDKISGEFR